MRTGLHVKDDIELKANLRIEARERGKLVAQHVGHNIFLNVGREWLPALCVYSSFSPDTPERDDRLRYIGFGIGGSSQLVASIPSAVDTAYPGTNTQTDTDPTVTALERPVRVSGSSATTPGLAGDLWLGQVQAPPVHGTATQVTLKRLFTELEVSYEPFLSVPLSEVGLFLSSADPEVYSNTAVAYDTFDTISKTAAISIEVSWTLRF